MQQIRLKSYPGALREMKQKGELWRFARHRRGRWLNNRVEQDHRRIKRLTRPMLGFQCFWTAKRTLAGIEAMTMLAKGQVRACPRVTCQRSELLYNRSSALRPERRKAGRHSPAVSQCNGTTNPIMPVANKRFRAIGKPHQAQEEGRTVLKAGAARLGF